MNDTTPLSPDPGLTFWGAAAAVSGSMHLLDAPRSADVSRSGSDRSRVLLDCGMYQGKREVARERNEKFPFHPRQLTAVIVSHGHIDHCGNLPTLVKQGFTGPIFATPATRDLIRVMLRDSARIQEEDAAHLNIARNYAEPWVEPLYTAADVDETFRRIVGVPYGKETEAAPGVRFTLTEAGHILGSALVHMVIDAPDRKRTLTFSGDLGRRGLPLLKPAGDVPPADLLVCESTYGNRKHEPVGGTIEKLYGVVRDTVARGGKVLIPAFSLGRCQLIIHFLQQGLRAGKVPRVPVYVDSPLASNVAEVYRSHPDALHPEVAVGVREGHGILGGDGVEYVRSGEESQQLATRPGPCVVIASSGMCDAGRIVNHLKHNVDDPRSTVALVSYQAQGTTGRRLLEAKPTIRIAGKDWNKWIDVVHLEGFSGHADKDDFLAYLTPLAGKVGKVRLIHGEREQAAALAGTLREIGFDDVAVPEPGDRVIIG